MILFVTEAGCKHLTIDLCPRASTHAAKPVTVEQAPVTLGALSATRRRAEIVLIAVQSVRSRPRKPAITQIPRDRSWVAPGGSCALPQSATDPAVPPRRPHQCLGARPPKQPPPPPSQASCPRQESCQLISGGKSRKVSLYSSAICNWNLHFKFG